MKTHHELKSTPFRQFSCSNQLKNAYSTTLFCISRIYIDIFFYVRIGVWSELLVSSPLRLDGINTVYRAL